MYPLSEIIVWITSTFALIVAIVLISIYLKLNNYYELTGYEGLKYFKNSFISLIFSFLLMYLLEMMDVIQISNIHTEIILVRLLVVSILWFLYNYVMTFFFNDIKEKHIKLYEIFGNEKKALFVVIVFGLILAPLISIPLLFFPLLFFYTIYKKTRQSSRIFKYFIVYNLLILSYTINLIQLIGFELYNNFLVDIFIFVLQILLYVIIWKEVSTQ